MNPMNETQKFLLVIALVVMAATTFKAPYHWSATDAIASITVRPGFQRHGSTYAPVWASQSSLTGDVTTRAAWVLEQVEVNLNVGLLGLWWAGIAAVTTVAILLTAGVLEPGESRPSGRR